MDFMFARDLIEGFLTLYCIENHGNFLSGSERFSHGEIVPQISLIRWSSFPRPFNTIIQNSPIWVGHFKLKSMGYPEQEKKVKRISRSMYRSKTFETDGLVDEIIKGVNKYQTNSSSSTPTRRDL